MYLDVYNILSNFLLVILVWLHFYDYIARTVLQLLVGNANIVFCTILLV